MTTRKNILILMHNDATQFIDIANQYVALFDTKKYKVTVAFITGHSNENTKKRIISEEILFLNCSKQDMRGLKIHAIKKLVMLCRKEKFALVISHRYKPIYMMLWVARFCSISAMIFVMHAMKTMESFSRKLLIRALLSQNMLFAGVSNAVRDDLRHAMYHIPHDRIITLYNCIDMKAAEKLLLSKKEARDDLHLPEDALVIGTIGRLAPEKDQKNIIYAFATLKSHFTHAKLLIMGDGPLEHDLKKLTEQLHLQDDVIFTGFVREAQRYLKAFDIFILSSTKEAFGRVLLEAMVAKIPVVGTRTDGIPEVIGEAGFIVNARDSTALSSTLFTLAELPVTERSAWGDKGYDRVKTHFSIESFNKIFWEDAIIK